MEVVSFAVMRLADGGGTAEVEGGERDAGRVSEGMAEEVMAPAEGEPIELLSEMA